MFFVSLNIKVENVDTEWNDLVLSFTVLSHTKIPPLSFLYYSSASDRGKEEGW